MRWYLVLLLSDVFLYYAAALKPPIWLKPCSRKDPNFSACAIESANYAIPILLNGDKKIGLPSFNPFRISQVELFGQDSFTLKLKDLKAYGLDQIKLLDLKVNFENRTTTVNTFVPKIDILADYEIDGRILFLPLKGSGPCMLSFVNGTYDFNFTFDLEVRDGKEYAKINEALSTFDYELMNVMFHLENLFNGDKRLGDETNKLLNESWRELNKELKGSIVETLLKIYGELAKKLYEKIPYNELVLL